MNVPKWQKQAGTIVSYEFHALVRLLLEVDALKTGRQLSIESWTGACARSKVFETDLQKILAEAGLLCVRRERILFQTGTVDDFLIFTGEHGAVQVVPSYSGSVFVPTLRYTGYSAVLQAALDQLCVEHLVKNSAGSLHAFMADSSGGTTLGNLGSSGQKLVRSNYMPSAVEAYDSVVKSLVATEPFGRLVILEGPPGSGKTHLMGALLQDSVADFVSVRPEMMSSLTSPQYIKVLAEKHTAGRPIVLLCEDADQCLVERAGDNMSDIGALLNLSDGLIGTVLDLRIIVSTNAPKTRFDPAITRPGRLLKHIVVGKLEPEQATVCFKELTGETRTFRESLSLAEIYALAKGHTEDVSSKPHLRAVGFGG